MKKYAKPLERLKAAYDAGVDEVAEQVRVEVIAPLCNKYDLKFLSGNGSWSFYTRDADRKDRLFYDGVIGDMDDVEKAKLPRRAFQEAFDILDLEVGDRFNLGHFVGDVPYPNNTGGKT